MPKIIDVPGHGHVEFPDNMSDDQIVAAIKKNTQPEPSMLESVGGALKRGLEGAAVGISDIGNPIVNAIASQVGKVVPAVGQWNRTRNADLDEIQSRNKDSAAFSAGRVGANIAATLPVGGALAGGLSKVPLLAERAPALINSIRTAGFTTGAPAATTLAGQAANLGVRAAGGAITGGASSALVNPQEVGTGALVGAVLPPGLAIAGKGVTQLGKAGYSLIQPYTKAGQNRLAGGIINKFAADGPTALDLAEHVPGSLPTLAEATGNPGISRLQSLVHDLRPNLFNQRAEGNAAARQTAFDGIAGNKNMLADLISQRDQTANALYGQAFAAEGMRQAIAAESLGQRAPFSGVGLSGAPDDLATPGLRALMVRPGFKAATQQAKTLAADNGNPISDPLQSLQGLHYVKLALDDALNPGVASSLGRNASAAVMGMRNRLADELGEISPLYQSGRQAYADMSKPIDAMEALQGLEITDPKGNITLSKVHSAIRSLEKQRAEPGVNPAKAVTDDQLNVLYGMRDDLRRQLNGLDKGKSRGATTWQNAATDNILTSMLPGKLAEMAADKAGGWVGQMGRFLYSGPNEAVGNRLVDLMLDPVAAKAAMEAAGHPLLQGYPNVNALAAPGNRLLELAYRTAAPIATSQ